MGSQDEMYCCGAAKKVDGEPCTRKVDSPESQCWQHQNDDHGTGRPSHQPTDATRAIVEALAMEGHNQETIAEHVGVCVETLVKYYREILEKAELSANAQVVQTAFAMATSGNNPSMTRYWLNCRTGEWKNQKNLDVTSDGDKMESGGTIEIVIQDEVVGAGDDEG